jgi:hypothetical protein
MTDETVAAQAEGGALPTSSQTLEQKVDAVIQTDATTRAARADEAVSQWYAAHFNACAKSGRPPITTDELARLRVQVKAAVSIA